jgi:predicted deacetylase
MPGLRGEVFGISFPQKRSWMGTALTGRRILVILAIIFSSTLPGCASQSANKPPIVLRIDDIQDFAFRDAQIRLMEISINDQIPVSWSVIPSQFGKDDQVLQLVKKELDQGSEVTIHGWAHEDLSALPLEEQEILLAQSQSTIQNLLSVDVKILVPPMFAFSDNTVLAMKKTGFAVVSSYVDIVKPGLIANVESIPGTVTLSDLSENRWIIRDYDGVQKDIADSVKQFGYAIIVTHPQEFIDENEVNDEKIDEFRTLLLDLKQDYRFAVISNLDARPEP